MIARFVLVLTIIFLSACSTTPPTGTNFSQVFCDRYLIYPLCAQDITGNGRTDLVYFEDSREIFLFNQKHSNSLPNNLTMHKCAQRMDRPLIDATSLLLTVNEETGFFRRAEIKNGIFLHYMRYLPRVSRCTPEPAPMDLELEDDFGVAENSEF